MNHKTLVQNALDGTVSYTEASELILAEIDALKHSFNYIVEGALKEHQDQSTHRHEPPLDGLHSLQKLSERIQTHGIAIQHFGIQTDLKQSIFPVNYQCFPSITVRHTSVCSDLNFLMARNVYESYLSM